MHSSALSLTNTTNPDQRQCSDEPSPATPILVTDKVGRPNQLPMSFSTQSLNTTISSPEQVCRLSPERLSSLPHGPSMLDIYASCSMDEETQRRLASYALEHPSKEVSSPQHRLGAEHQSPYSTDIVTNPKYKSSPTNSNELEPTTPPKYQSGPSPAIKMEHDQYHYHHQPAEPHPQLPIPTARPTNIHTGTFVEVDDDVDNEDTYPPDRETKLTRYATALGQTSLLPNRLDAGLAHAMSREMEFDAIIFRSARQLPVVRLGDRPRLRRDPRQRRDRVHK